MVSSLATRVSERLVVDISTDDILAALGLGNLRSLRRELKLLFRYPALAFARTMIAFDRAVKERGIDEAASILLAAFASGLRVTGAQSIPREGPVLFVSNHPGITDTPSLFSALGRKDLKILGATRPLVLALPAVREHVVLVPEDPSKAARAIGPAIAHLKGGGALLSFPAGAIEPDPAIAAGALRSLGSWSASTALFVRLIPDLAVVPIVVSGVLAPRAQHSPFTLIRRTRAGRESLGAMLQVIHEILIPGRWKTRVRVDILARLEGRALAALRDRDAVLAAVRAEVEGRLRELETLRSGVT